MSWMDIALLILIAAQQFFYMRQIQLLVDKVMAKSYTEYVAAKKPAPPKVILPQEVPEDLRSLQEFSIL